MPEPEEYGDFSPPLPTALGRMLHERFAPQDVREWERRETLP